MKGPALCFAVLILLINSLTSALGQPPDLPKSLRTPELEAFLSSAEGRSFLAGSMALMQEEVARNRADPSLTDYYKHLDAHEDFAAFFAIQRPANAGHAHAQAELAWMYFSGTGTSEDMDKAKDWYAKAAKLGDLSAASTLGGILSNPQFGQPDYRRATRILRKCAINLRPSCVVQLARLYSLPENPERNIAAGLVWSSIAVIGNFPAAQRIDDMVKAVASAADVLAAKELEAEIVRQILAARTAGRHDATGPPTD